MRRLAAVLRIYSERERERETERETERDTERDRESTSTVVSHPTRLPMTATGSFSCWYFQLPVKKNPREA